MNCLICNFHLTPHTFKNITPLKLCSNKWEIFCKYLNIPSHFEDIRQSYLKLNSHPFCESCDILLQELIELDQNISHLTNIAVSKIIQVTTINSHDDSQGSTVLSARVNSLRHNVCQRFNPTVELTRCQSEKAEKLNKNIAKSSIDLKEIPRGHQTEGSQPDKISVGGSQRFDPIRQPFQCEKCSMTFRRLYKLRDHMQSHNRSSQGQQFTHEKVPEKIVPVTIQKVILDPPDPVKIYKPSIQLVEEPNIEVMEEGTNELDQIIIKIEDDDDQIIYLQPEACQIQIQDQDYQLMTLDPSTFSYGGYFFQNNGNVLHCLKCGAQEKYLENMKIHIKYHHIEKVLQKESSIPRRNFEKKDYGYECCTCHQILPTYIQIVKHVEKCLNRTKTTETSLEMRIQEEIHNIQTESDPLAILGDLDPDQESWRRNLFPKVDTFKKCPLCPNLLVESPSDLTDHFWKHQNEVAVGGYKDKKTCFLCQKTLSNTHSLQRHIKAHCSDRRYKCSVCQKEFLEGDKLKGHLFLVHRIRGESEAS